MSEVPVPAGYELDDDRSRFDLDAAWNLLDRYAYWARHRTRDVVERQIAGSWRVLAAYHEDQLIGFARAMADGETLGYLADVVVAPEHRGRGVGRALAKAMIEDGPAIGWRWMLHTRDAHTLYASLGFAPAGGNYLERPGPVWGGAPGMGGSPSEASALYVATFHVPAAGVEKFQTYETEALVILRDHGARVERRLRGPGGEVEVHLLRFASTTAYEAYLSDPRRAAIAALFEQSGATVDVSPVADLPPP
jgi:GNAT superfamily N-acetyltransferase